MTLAAWYDIRSLSNPVRALLGQIDKVAPEWAVYLIAGVIGVLGIMAFLVPSQLAVIWIERRLIGLFQARRGPNRVGPAGLLQPLADALKVMAKEAITPRGADKPLFWLAPIVIFVAAIGVYAVIPFGDRMVLADLNVGVLFVVAITSLSTLAVFMAGWSSNNKYALLGAMRVVAMMISYELPLVFSLLTVVVFTGTMSLQEIVLWQSDHYAWLVFILPLPFLVFFIASSAELNRTPADIAEAESEIIAGYHIEYSGMRFSLFYAAEYTAALASSALLATLFLGGWTLFGLEEWVPGWLIFIGKIYFFFVVWVWIRATLPRLRIDQLMAYAWKFLLPASIAMVALAAGERILWEETGLRPLVALPAFAVANVAVSALVVVVMARVAGYRPERLPRRARLAKTVGLEA